MTPIERMAKATDAAPLQEYLDRKAAEKQYLPLMRAAINIYHRYPDDPDVQTVANAFMKRLDGEAAARMKFYLKGILTANTAPSDGSDDA